MIKAIIWKDIRLLAIGLLGQLVVMLIPPALYTAFMLMNQDDWPPTVVELRMQLSDVLAFMAAACLLITPVLGAIPLARERRERSGDFLSTVPIARGVHIVSKLGVFIVLTVLAPLACAAVARLIAPHEPGAFRHPIVFDRELVAGVCLVFLSLGGVSWFFGSMMRSEAIAAGCTFLVVIVAGLAITLVAERYRIEPPRVFQWFVITMTSTGLGGLLCGTAIAFARRAW